MEDILKEMADISGLDPCGVWPLAIGWWIIIAIAILFIAVTSYYIIKKAKYKKTLNFVLWNRLGDLEKI